MTKERDPICMDNPFKYISLDKRLGFTVDPAAISIEPGFNVRENTVPDEELILSIKAVGIIQPLIVRRNPDHSGSFLLVDGERRLHAALQLEMRYIPVLDVGCVSTSEALILLLSSDKNKKPLILREQIAAIMRLQALGNTVKEIARAMCRNEWDVACILKAKISGYYAVRTSLMKGPDEGGIHPRVAARIAQFPEEEKQEELVERVKGKSLPEATRIVREAEEGTSVPIRRGPTPVAKTSAAQLKANALLRAEAKEWVEQHPEDLVAIVINHVLEAEDAQVPLEYIRSKVFELLYSNGGAQTSSAEVVLPPV